MSLDSNADESLVVIGSPTLNRFPILLSMIHDSHVSTQLNCDPRWKMALALQLILTPMIWKLASNHVVFGLRVSMERTQRQRTADAIDSSRWMRFKRLIQDIQDANVWPMRRSLYLLTTSILILRMRNGQIDRFVLSAGHSMLTMR